MKKVLLLVKSHSDKMVAENLLLAAKLPTEAVEIKPIGNFKNSIKTMEMEINNYENVALLIDSDEIFVANAKKSANEMVADSPISVFFAVEEIEAWLFADLDWLKSLAPKKLETRIDNLPLPEEIIYPKLVLNKLIRYDARYFDYQLLQQINILKACARSSSLKDFITGMAVFLKVQIPDIEDATSLNMNMKLFSNLLKEVLNKEQIVYKSLNNYQYSAAELIQNIENGTELGRTYVVDLLRISRNLLQRQANSIK